MVEEEAPSLISLCLNAIADELLRGVHDDDDDDFTQAIYQLPSELLDSLLPRLTPLALELLQRRMPFCGRQDDNSGTQRKRKRWLNFEMAWKVLYETRWPSRVTQGCHNWLAGKGEVKDELIDDWGQMYWKTSYGTQSHPINWLAEKGEVKDEPIDDWAQMYWETHLQNCVDAAAEIALLPSFNGSIGLIQIPASLLKYMSNCRHMNELLCDYSKFSDHCQHFGSYARCLKLSSSLCVPEICDLLRNSKLESLEIQWIKSKQHVDGLCALLKQNCETLKSVELIHCKLLATFINDICDSLWIKDLKTHGIQHFSIKLSSFLEANCFPLPVGMASFLSSGRSLSSLRLCDDGLHKNFVKMVIDTLLDGSSTIANLDLSENFISGWLSHFKWSTNSEQLSSGIGKSLQSLRVLNLRNNNLESDDVDCLKYALVHMPKLETLDLSDNPIEDGIMSMIPYFAEMAERPFPLVDLKLGNCGLTFNGVTQLLETLSTWKKPLRSLSIRENILGREVGASLGKFICKGILSLDIDCIGLDPSDFKDAQEAIMGNLKLVYINISKNRGGLETAMFLSKLISCAPELVAIDARYTFMPVESFSLLYSTLKAMKGKLEHLDLTGNSSFQTSADAAMLAELQNNGKCIIKLNPHTVVVPYDDDP